MEVQDHSFTEQTRFILEGSARAYRLASPPSAAAVSRVESALADAAAAANDVVTHAAAPSFITGVLEPSFPRSSDIVDIDRLVEPLGDVILHMAEGDCCGAKAISCVITHPIASD